MNKSEVKKFADLARIEMSDGELSKMSGEIESILDYVGQIKGAISSSKKSATTENRIESASVRNIFRPDETLHPRAVNKKKLLAEAPETDGNYIKVKKIL